MEGAYEALQQKCCGALALWTINIEHELIISEIIMTTLQENLDKVKNDYEIKIINGFHVLISEGLYVGLVSADKIVESEKSFSTLSGLVDHLYESLGQ